MPRISKKDQHVRQPNRDTKSISDCGNYLEHIRNHLAADDQINYAILGAVPWTAGDKSCSLFSKQLTAQQRPSGIVYVTVDRKYLREHQVAAASGPTD